MHSGLRRTPNTKGVKTVYYGNNMTQVITHDTNNRGIQSGSR